MLNVELTYNNFTRLNSHTYTHSHTVAKGMISGGYERERKCAKQIDLRLLLLRPCVNVEMSWIFYPTLRSMTTVGTASIPYTKLNLACIVEHYNN